jgi:hypothetical protein
MVRPVLPPLVIGLGVVLYLVTPPLRGQSDAEASARVELLPVACVDSGPVVLAEIADLSGMRDDQRQQLAQVVIGSAPTPGLVVQWPRSLIEQRLRENAPRLRCRLDGAGSVLVTRDVVAVRPEALVETALRWLTQSWPLWPAGYALEAVGPPRRPFYLPREATPVEIRPVPASARMIGSRVRLEVEIWAGQERYASVPLQFVLQPKGTGHSQELDEAAFGVVPAAYSGGRSTPEAFAEGRRSQLPRSMAPANARPSPPQPVTLVRRRDVVRLVARSAHLTATALGEALEDGQEGQLIRVRNITSHRVVVGRVGADGTVEVVF